MQISFHPHFIMATGMPTHFRSSTGEDVAIATHVHLFSDHVAAAFGAGFTLAELREAVVDDVWIAAKPTWERYRGHPISMAAVWRADPSHRGAREDGSACLGGDGCSSWWPWRWVGSSPTT